MNPPNILYIMTDQQRFDDLGVYARTPVSTPNLDALAASGTRFDNAYSVCALCSPARASMLCGTYPHAHRMWNNNDMMQWARRNLPDEVSLISQTLAASGYRCGYVGKWHCGHEKVPSSYGFEGMDVPDYGFVYDTSYYRHYCEARGVSRPTPRVEVRCTGPRPYTLAGVSEGDIRGEGTYFLSEYAIDMIQRFSAGQPAGGRPWLIVLSYWSPHPAYLPPSSFADMYDPQAIEIRPDLHDNLEGKPPNQRRYRERYHRTLELEEGARKLVLARAFAQVSFLDSQIGRVLANLDELGLRQHTAVLFASDHGDMRLSHGGFFDKDAYMYEEIYHIPQIVRWLGPGRQPGVCDRFVSNMDLAATALDIGGLDVPQDYHARSLVGLLGAAPAPWPDDVMCEYHGHRFLCSVRMVRWSHYKYVLNLASFDELYDLKADPHELANRIDDRALQAVAAEGRERLLRRIEATGDAILFAAREALAH